MSINPIGYIFHGGRALHEGDAHPASGVGLVAFHAVHGELEALQVGGHEVGGEEVGADFGVRIVL